MMETKKNSTYEKEIIKRQALEKLDKLLKAELKRLHDISPEKPLFEQFEILSDNNYFTPEEFEEVKGSITKLNQLSSNNPDIRGCSKKYLEITLKTRAIECPWKECL